MLEMYREYMRLCDLAFQSFDRPSLDSDKPYIDVTGLITGVYISYFKNGWQSGENIKATVTLKVYLEDEKALSKLKDFNDYAEGDLKAWEALNS